MNAKKLAKALKSLFLLLLAAGIAYVFVQYRGQLTVDAVRFLVESYGSLGPLVFGVIYIIALLFLLSAAFMSVLAGVLFGKFLGSVTVVIAATIAAAIAFALTRYFGAQVTAYLEKGIISNLVKRVNDACTKGGIKTWFIIRSLFLPYIPVSYAAGLVRKAKFRDFIAGTLITNAIYSPVFVYFGDQALKGPKALLLPAALILLVLFVPKAVKKLHKP